MKTSHRLITSEPVGETISLPGLQVTRNISFFQYLLHNPTKRRQIFLLIGDFLSFFITGLFCFYFNELSIIHLRNIALLSLLVFSLIFMSYLLGYYKNISLSRDTLFKLFVLFIAIFVAAIMWEINFRECQPTSAYFTLSFCLGVVLTVGNHCVQGNCAIYPVKTLAFWGEHPLVRKIVKEINKEGWRHFKVIANDGKDKLAFEATEDMVQVLRGQRLDILCLATEKRVAQAGQLSLLHNQPKLKMFTVRDFYEILTGKVYLPLDSPRINALISKTECHSFYDRLKRVFDIGAVAVTSATFALQALLIALAIRLTSKGSPLFRQQKMGKGRKPFWFLKFQSMVPLAEVAHGLDAVTVENDPRITPLGRILRLTHFDELPQIINIFKGEMSFIGPRPLNVHLEETLASRIPQHSLRYLVLPGITGWAQINHPDSRSQEGQRERLQYDLFYIRHHSFLMDAFICLKSIRILLTGFGAR